MLREQIHIAEIHAPTGHEARRGEYVAQEFRKAGLTGVTTDEVGNVLGFKYGHGKGMLAITAHLDTVHPPGIAIRLTRQGNVIEGPGAADDAGGLVTVLELARSWNTEHALDLLFAATVGEEGRGDLKGARHLVKTNKIDLFVSLDGATPGQIINGGIGSRRWRIGFVSEGGGGHSWKDFGRANPAHALARLIARMAQYDAPREPKTTFNIGVISSASDDALVMGTSVNTIPASAMAQVDMRSVDARELKRVEAHLMASAKQALATENSWSTQRGQNVPVRLLKELVGDRPFGHTSPSHPLVRVVRQELERAGLDVELGWASTDANAAMAAGIPAVTLSFGGTSTGVHGAKERYDATGRRHEFDAVRRALTRLAADWTRDRGANQGVRAELSWRLMEFATPPTRRASSATRAVTSLE